MKFISTKYPSLYVHDLGVRFKDGVAEVRDKKTQDALKAVDGVRPASKAEQEPAEGHGTDDNPPAGDGAAK